MEKKYLHLTVLTHGGTTFTNPLQLGEAYIISQIAQEHKQIKVKLEKCSKAQYKAIFG